jgi:hypothetical protein
MKIATQKRAAQGRPLTSSIAAGRRYPRKVRRGAGCIMTAATLKQTAVPHATVKSEIHMARYPFAVLIPP